MRFSSRTAPLQAEVSVGFRRRSAWAACLGLVALLLPGWAILSLRPTGWPSQRIGICLAGQCARRAGTTWSGIAKLKGAFDISHQDLQPWATSDAQVYGPAIRSHQLLARQVQKELDVAFDQSNRLLPQHRGCSSQLFRSGSTGFSESVEARRLHWSLRRVESAHPVGSTR